MLWPGSKGPSMPDLVDMAEDEGPTELASQTSLMRPTYDASKGTGPLEQLP